MPYLSRIWLNPLRTGAQKLLRNPQAVHAAVLGGLSRQPVGERMLWRLEPGSDHRAELLVLSPTRPSWEHVVEQAGWPGCDEPQALVRDYAPLLERVVVGREFAFRLCANTVTSTKNPVAPTTRQQARLAGPRPRGVRVSERTAAQQLAWFERRLPVWGLEVLGDTGSPALQLAARRTIQFAKTEAEGERRRVTLQTATADGAVRIADASMVREVLVSGCGSGRAYGCGLLTLAPLAER